ncbi:hypothetical protein CEXT_738091 [Caerostris extrusa]|uniref:Uncharacterized protein n=1 Tax=Caerostris extrusa TaxID=172846 RepID=A0AAV4T7Y6_CAEEX|nr:hypothetical protein CEXT_738091 [Caerostris extrusa]
MIQLAFQEERLGRGKIAALEPSGHFVITYDLPEKNQELKQGRSYHLVGKNCGGNNWLIYIFQQKSRRKRGRRKRGNGIASERTNCSQTSP